jgi:hypothetical protein
MIPIIASSSEFRAHIAKYLNADGLVLINSKGRKKVLVDEAEYNRLLALANQFEYEDPEGTYKQSFVNEMLNRAKEAQLSEVTDLADLIKSEND